MLTDLTDEGHASWTCPHCHAEQTEHISHRAMEWTPRAHIDALIARGLSLEEATRAMSHHDMISLPPCGCGTRTFLKADFTGNDLAAPNMLDEEGNPTPSHAAAHRHMALAQQMKLIGKGTPEN